MRSFPYKIFLICFLALALILFCFPINLFSGEIVMTQGLQRVVVQAPLSLSYFVGMGYEEKDMDGIEDFYLLPAGYLLSGIILIGIPFLVALRIHLKRTK